MTPSTASEVIKKAYTHAQKIARGGTPTPAQYLDGLSTLNDVVNYEQTQGLKLWLETETSVALQAGKQVYSLMTGGDVSTARPLRIKEAAFWDAQGNVRPLTLISREEWTRLSSRNITGSVTQIFPEKLFDRLNLYLWHIPDAVAAAGSVKVVLHNQATNASIISEDTRFPPEWVLFLQWRLAQELVTGMPQETIMRCDTMMQRYKEGLEAFDVEDAPTYFVMDYQGQGRRFR